MKKITKPLILILWIAFIFANSFQNGTTSGQISGDVVAFLYDILTKLKITVDLNTLSLLVRKAAHLFEFFILGILSFINILEYVQEKKYFYLYIFLLPLVIAICDETIQTFIVGRSGSLIDCCIDYIGSLLGLGLMFLINHLKMRRKRKEDHCS